jgi:hypothetical protein
MIKKLFGILLILVLTNTFAQEFITEEEATGKKERSTFWERVYFGGDFGMAFGSVTSVNVAPEMGYIFTDRFSAGGGIIYQYYSYSSNYNPFKTSVYGGKVFFRYFVWDNVFLYNVNEIVSLESKYYDYTGQYQNQNRFWMISPLLGAGYMSRFSNKGGISLMVLFNLNNSENSPYYSYDGMPILRIGVAF